MTPRKSRAGRTPPGVPAEGVPAEGVPAGGEGMEELVAEVVSPEPGARSVEERFRRRIEMKVPDRHNPRLRRAMDWVNGSDEVYGHWVAANVNAIERLGMSDHGPVHVKIVMNMAVRLLRLLMDRGVEPSVVTYYGLDGEDAELVVALGALFHDLGMSIHREDHESYSLFIADGLLKELLPTIYDRRKSAILRAEILHAIIGHRSDGHPLTVEAGVVRIADALDMAKGRSRIPFEAGSVSIHSVSAAAVERVHLTAGVEKPVRIEIELSNSAGIFQLDELFRRKLKGSGLEQHVELVASLEGESEKRLFKEFQL
jgi:metal-dependent HD superfamily phosphatase/phosphodiesterase